MQSIDKKQALDPSLYYYRRMRELRPVYYHPKEKRWTVYRYREAEQVLNNARLFSSGVSDVAPSDPKYSDADPLAISLLNLNPPYHRQYRHLVTQALTPRAVAQLSDRITQMVTHLLDEVAEVGTLDVYDHLASPLPALVIAELLGIPREDRALFITWSNIIGHGGRAPTTMIDYFLQVMKERHESPQDDLISALIAAEIDGRHLIQQELLGFCVLFLAAGIQPARNLIASTFRCLAEHPHILEQLHEEPHLIAGAIEEVLRYSSPFEFVSRIALVDTLLGDQQIQAGQRIIVHLASANRDDAQFSDPDCFDIRRTPNRHLTFGHGIHFCIGAPLARLETKIMLSLLQERFQDIRHLPQVLDPMKKSQVPDPIHPTMPMTFQQREKKSQ
jgi:cytochrome P450